MLSQSWGAGGAAPRPCHTLCPAPQPIVKSVAGDVIDFPKPRSPIKVPPKDDHTSQVLVPLYLFSTVFGLLQANGALNIDITSELVSVAPAPLCPGNAGDDKVTLSPVSLDKPSSL